MHKRHSALVNLEKGRSNLVYPGMEWEWRKDWGYSYLIGVYFHIWIQKDPLVFDRGSTSSQTPTMFNLLSRNTETSTSELDLRLFDQLGPTFWDSDQLWPHGSRPGLRKGEKPPIMSLLRGPSPSHRRYRIFGPCERTQGLPSQYVLYLITLLQFINEWIRAKWLSDRRTNPFCTKLIDSEI